MTVQHPLCCSPAQGVRQLAVACSGKSLITHRASTCILLLQVYGLHPNADITKDQQETNQLLDSLLASQGTAGTSGGSSAGASRDALLLQLAAELDGRLRAPFDIEAARYK